MSRIIAFIVRRPRAIISMVIALSAFFACGLWRGVQLDVSPLGFVERDGQTRADFETARKNFGPDDYLVVAVACDDVFTPAGVSRLRELHDRILKTSGVAEVLSLVNAPYARSVDGVVSAESLLPDGATGRRGDGAAERLGIERQMDGENGVTVALSPRLPVSPSRDPQSAIEEIRRLATGDRLYVGNLVSADSNTAALNILLKSDLPTATRHAITKRIYDLARGAGFDQVYFAGDPFSQWHSTEAVKRDLRLFLPLTLLFIAFLLWLCFRSFVVVALLLLTIGVGLLWLMGLMAWFESHFTILALMLPTLMVAIGCSYMVHVINQIGISKARDGAMGRHGDGEKESQGSVGSLNLSVSPTPRLPDAPAPIEEALRFISLPVIVSALTIIAGFLSLTFTAIPAVRSTAIYSAIGAAFTMVLSLTFIPAALALMGDQAITFRVGLTGGMVRLLEGVGRWATTNQTPLYILTAVLVVVSAIGAGRIVIDIDYFHFARPNSEASVGLAEVSKRLSGAVNFDIIIEGKDAGAIEKPETLRRIAELQSFAETRRYANGQGIDRALSVVDFVKHVNRAFHDNDPRHYDLPSDDGVIGELLSDRDKLRQFLTPDGRIARILIRSNLSTSQAMASAIREIEARGRELLPDSRVFATGTFVMLNRTSDQIAGEQLQSVTIALVTIYLMLSILFGSLRVGFTALVPNLIPILFFFGFMGWRGVELNLTTSLVASVVLGLAVDNAVQFIARFRRAQAGTPDLRDAILDSMRLSGRPIIYANVALAATFAIFFFSNFKPIASFGLLSAVTIIGCLIEDLVLLPARLTSPVFRAK
jgi:predicted RND superfamily exporter protein